jgi:hypothetical protein
MPEYPKCVYLDVCALCRPADAAHLAFAEAAQASFVSCDDRLLRLCQRIQPNVWYGTPIAFCAEEGL